MVSTKDLRDIFNDLTNEAGKRASDVVGRIDKADLPDLSNISIGRRNEPPGLLWFGIGLTLGAVIGMLAAFLSTPYNGEQARKKVVEQVEKVRKPKEDLGTVGTNGSSSYATPTSAYERS
jgi:hypothetical protein